MTITEFVQRFDARKSGKGWMMKCPSHDDSKASLHIDQTQNGIVLLHCFAGCSQDAVVSALGITMNDLFPKETSKSANPAPKRKLAAKQSPPFDWQKHVAAFTEKDVRRIASWRGLSSETVRKLRGDGLIGIHNHFGNRLVAFPVHNGGQVVGCHFRLTDGTWQYFPKGITAELLLIGELQPDRNHIFESTWDGIDYADKSGEVDGIIITRGVGNAKRAAKLIPRDSTAILWPQEDQAAKKWEHDFVEASTCRIRRVMIPAHDLNDWTRNGATANDVMAALLSAETIRARPLEIETADESPEETLLTPIMLDDFCAYMPMHNYIFIPARDVWPASSVNARIPPVPLMRDGEPMLDEDSEQKTINASAWLDRNRPVEMMTWAPGMPMFIKNRLISEGGWIEHRGCSTFNLYRPPTIKRGDASKAGKWLDHVAMVYPYDKDHIIRWLAFHVQRPHVKINHALVLIGGQGIGKDTMLHPVKHAVGIWNVKDILPPALLGRFNGFVKAVLLIINEIHDLGDLDRYSFYERLKAYTAAPPDTIRVDEKHLREYEVLNVCGVILTSNYKTGGLYLPADDRRHYIAWSDLDKRDIPEQYWQDIYAWYDVDGCRHIAAYLAQLDISDFNPKAPPPKTDAFWEIVDSNRAPETSELADAIEYLDNPDVVTVAEVIETQFVDVISSDFADWLKDRKNGRQIPYRFEEIGYIAVRNPDHKSEGRWWVGKRRCAIYAKKTLSKRDQLAFARAKAEAGRPE